MLVWRDPGPLRIADRNVDDDAVWVFHLERLRGRRTGIVRPRIVHPLERDRKAELAAAANRGGQVVDLHPDVQIGPQPRDVRWPLRAAVLEDAEVVVAVGQVV